MTAPSALARWVVGAQSFAALEVLVTVVTDLIGVAVPDLVEQGSQAVSRHRVLGAIGQ